MNRLYIFILLLLPFSLKAQVQSDSSQNQRRWSLTIGAGFGTTWRHNTFFDANGLIISAEPMIKVSRIIDIGAKAEYAFIKTYYTGESANTEVNAKSFPSLLLTGNIKPWNGSISPFIGAGAGLYFLGTATTGGNSNTETDLQTRFGVAPRIGISIFNFGIQAELNLIDEKTLFNRDYVTIKATYTIR